MKKFALIAFFGLLISGIGKVNAKQKVVLKKVGGKLKLPSPKPKGLKLIDDNCIEFTSFQKNKNWTQIFKYISTTICEDKFAGRMGASFEVLIYGSADPYIIGAQKKGTNIFLAGQNIFEFVGRERSSVKNITVKGVEGKPQLKYEDNLYYGTWLPPNFQGKICNKSFSNSKSYPVVFPLNEKCNNERRTNCTIGFTFLLKHCENVSIENLSFDGNMDKMKLGGFAGKKNIGRQMAYSGIVVHSGKNVTAKNLEIRRYGLDGMTVRAKSQNVTIDNLNSEFNGRQGLTWAGGDKLTVLNSKFNNSGRGIIHSPPSAGLDIEPSLYTKEDKSRAKGSCTNGTFKGCEFINSMGCNLVQHKGEEAIGVLFENCKFESFHKRYSIWCRGRDFTFKNCSIIGGFVHGNGESDPQWATKFYNTTFSHPSSSKDNNTKPYLLSSQHGKNMIIDGCTFNIENNRHSFINLISKENGGSAYNQIRNCKFIQKGKSNQKHKNLLNFVQLKGENVFQNQSSSSTNYFILSNVEIGDRFSNSIKNETEVKGNVNLVLKGSKFKMYRGNQPSVLRVKSGAEVEIYPGTNWTMESGTKLITESNGKLISHSNQLSNSGEIRMESGSAYSVPTSAKKKMNISSGAVEDFNVRVKKVKSPIKRKTQPHRKY